jgi:hypothetical protein
LIASFSINARFGSEADMCGAKGHVRFTPEATLSAFIQMSAMGRKRTLVRLFDHFVGAGSGNSA